MPTAPRRACSTPRCPNVQPCQVHPSRRQWAGRGTPAARGYGTDWQKLRALVLARDGYACQATLRLPNHLGPEKICGAQATHVDHMVPKHLGGTEDPGNLESLCARHHAAKTGREGRRAR